MENDELLHKWVNGTLTAEELEVFKQRPEYESLTTLRQQSDDMAPPPFDGDRVLRSILQQKKESIPDKRRRKRILPVWTRYAAAAVILLLAGWFFWPSNGNLTKLQLAKAERIDAYLPDQSAFVLNAESTLEYDEQNWASDRRLWLKGEAFFEVKKGSTFEVITPTGTVKVLGTRFNVRARKPVLEVACQSGKVAIYQPDGSLVGQLEAGDVMRISKDKPVERWASSEGSASGWVNGVSKFRKVPLKVILAELERQFDIQIHSRNIDVEEIVTGNFQHEDLELALKTALGMEMTYTIKNEKQVYLHKKE